ncbi:MAG: hypothetical protein PVI57_02870 [Gemmatimonadota bacterium]
MSRRKGKGGAFTGRAAAGLTCVAMLAACEALPTGSVGDPQSSRGPEELSEAYRIDAARLAVRNVRSRSASPLPPVEVQPAIANAFHDALLAVRALDHPARDSVTELYEIHTFPEPPLREVIVGLRPGSRLASAWEAGRTRTGEPAADALIDRYGLTLVTYRSYTHSPPWAVLRAAQELDAGALALRFRAVPGVEYAEANGVAGDGNDIRSRNEDGALVLDFSVGFGDCPAGCIGRHTWSFRVRNGVAEFLGSSGPLPPAP